MGVACERVLQAGEGVRGGVVCAEEIEAVGARSGDGGGGFCGGGGGGELAGGRKEMAEVVGRAGGHGCVL